MDLGGEMLYNLAAGLGFVAYLMTNVLWLRMVLVIGALFYILTGLSLGIGSMVWWHVGYAVINISHITIILFNNSGIGLTEPARWIYVERFTSLKPREFQRILTINGAQAVTGGRLLQDGEPNDRLMLIISGEVEVRKSGAGVRRLGVGSFVGEMSVLTGSPVSSDVFAINRVEYRYWTLEDLRRLESKQLPLYNRFMMVVGRDLVEKLRVATSSQVEREARNTAPEDIATGPASGVTYGS